MDHADEQRLFDKLSLIGAERDEYDARGVELTKRAQQAAKKALEQGMRPSRVARALHYTDGYIRKLRIEANLPPDPRYAGVSPSKRYLGFGEVGIGIGDTMEEAMANAGPIDTGSDLRAMATALPIHTIAGLVDQLRQTEPVWFQQIQTRIDINRNVNVEIIVYALAEGKLTVADLHA